MKSNRLFTLLLVAAFALPALAHAHPGHDGDHDFVWDFDHLANHPLATISCLSLLVAAGWGVSRLLKSGQTTKSSEIKRD